MDKKLLFSIVTFLLLIANIQAQTVVNSLAALRAAVLNSDQQIVMTPGDYNFEDLASGSRDITFSGSNNTITLTGVYIKVPVGSVTQNYLDVSGDNNTIINGEVEDVYRNGMTEVTDFSAYNADRDNQAKGLGGDAVLQIMGSGNLLDGMKLTVRGSFPYGYGSMYGIGSENVFGLNKRCGILVNGIGNTIDNVELQQRAFGHGIFMQNDADQTVIKNTLVEGRVRNTGELYTETNSFDLPNLSGYLMPYEDRAIPTDEFHSLSEDGIRMYNIPGSITVENCTVKKMRGGVRLYLGGVAKVTNTTSIDCGLTNYNTQTNGEIISSSGNFTYAPLLEYSLNRRSTKVELTILPSPNATGPHNIADVTGSDNTITFHRTPGPLDKTDRAIVITSSNNTIVNETEYTIILESGTSGNKITSCGPVINRGSGNTITLSDCDFDITCSNTADNLQAECYDEMFGVEVIEINTNNDAVSSVENGDWIRFDDIDLLDFNAVQATVSSVLDDAAIEVREGSVTGTLLGIIQVPNTGDFTEYVETSIVDLVAGTDGLTTLYFVFTGGAGTLFNVDGIYFSKSKCLDTNIDPIKPIQSEWFCDASEVLVQDVTSVNQSVVGLKNEDYLFFPNIDFGTNHNFNAIQVYAASFSDGGTVEIRSGSVDGELLGTVEVTSTGAWANYETFVNRINNPITGIHNIYMVFTGVSEYLLSLDSFRFYEDNCANLTEAYSQIDALNYCESLGVSPINNEYLGGIHDGEWIRYGSVDFTSVSPDQVTLRLAGLSTTEGYVNIRLDDPETGSLVATTIVPKTGAWTNWQDVTVSLEQEVTGIHNLYVYFGNTAFNMDWLEFHEEKQDPCSDGVVNDASLIEIEDYCSMSGVQLESHSNGISNIGSIKNGAWTLHKNYDLTGKDKVKVSGASSTSGGNVEIRLNSVTGTLIGTVSVTGTGGWTTWKTSEANITSTSGIHDIYLVYTGGGSYLFNLDWISFENTLSMGNDFNLGGINISPNPSADQITIANASGTLLEVYNSSGALEVTVLVSEDVKVLSLEKLNAGVHFLKFKNNQETTVKKIIKN